MGGITGMIDFEQGGEPSVLESMTNVVRYRGPDDEGYALFNEEKTLFVSGKDTVDQILAETIPLSQVPGGTYPVSLGYRRLSVTDSSVYAHQPMNLAGRYTVVFNGEIYNYLELKESLNLLGYRFQGTGDTEVLVAAYAAWGKECVQYFNGVWAFCIFDRVKSELFLSRDRFGVKPLYYWKNGDRMLFASEIKQLLEAPFVPRVVHNQTAALHLLYFIHDTSEQTLFRDILAFPAGCNVTLSLDFFTRKIGEMHIERYYDLNTCEKPLIGQYDAAEKMGESLKRAVKLCMRSQNKVGSCLSGGLDSSSIVTLACDALRAKGEDPRQFKTFTSGFPDYPEIDETNFAKCVVDTSGCLNTVVAPTLNTGGNELKDMIWHLDYPVVGFSLLVQRNVFRAAAENGVRVLLDGQGSDENLAGYFGQCYSFLANCVKEHGIATFAMHYRQCAKNLGIERKRLLNAVRNKIKQQGNFPDNPAIFTSLLKDNEPKQFIHSLFLIKKDQDILLETMVSSSLPQILHWLDRNSMAFSVETRNPFLDHEFVEAALSMPLSQKLKNGWTKYPLRDYMKDKMPEEVVWRKNKFGFPAPDRAWLYGLDRDYVLDLFDNARSAPYYNIPLLREQYLKQEDPHFPLVRFVLFEIWMRVFKMEIKEDA